MYTQTENTQNHDPRTKLPYLYCQLSANGYYRKRSFLFKDINSHDLFSFQSNSVFTPLLNGINFYYLFRLSIQDRQIESSRVFLLQEGAWCNTVFELRS